MYKRQGVYNFNIVSFLALFFRHRLIVPQIRLNVLIFWYIRDFTFTCDYTLPAVCSYPVDVQGSEGFLWVQVLSGRYQFRGKPLCSSEMEESRPPAGGWIITRGTVYVIQSVPSKQPISCLAVGYYFKIFVMLIIELKRLNTVLILYEIFNCIMKIVNIINSRELQS